MANKPKKPERKIIGDYFAIEDGETLDAFMVRISSLDIRDGYFKVNEGGGCSCCYEPASVEFHYTRDESDQELAQRMESYLKRLAKWEAQNGK